MSITPNTPDWSARGGFKHGSILNGNLCPYRVTSQWKSTDGPFLDAAERIGELLTDAMGEDDSLKHNTMCDIGVLIHDR
jgi:hypothetical protein